MDMLKHLNEVNNVPIHAVDSELFQSYGRVIEGYDFSELIQYMRDETEIPETGNVYVASVPEMEGMQEKSRMETLLYGGLPIQIGYCNGRNSTYNGFEYHKGSEINVAVTDFMLVLGHTWEIHENHYDNQNAQVFFIPKGTAIEMYQTTLHLSPLKVTDDGFKGIVILPKGTNTPLMDVEREERDLALARLRADAGGKMPETGDTGEMDPENALLLQRNKWVIAHPDREPLIKQGAFPGIIGENKELFY